MLCEQRANAASCEGKFFGSGTTCHGFSCPLGGTNPNQCTIGAGGAGGGTGGAGGGGSSLICNRYTILEAGVSSTNGSGVILDTATGLKWTRYAYSPMTQAAAISHCLGLGMKLPNLDVAGRLSKCCVQTGTLNNCNAAFPGVWDTWTTTPATTGYAYYAMTPGFVCLPSTCISPVSSTHSVMCFK